MRLAELQQALQAVNPAAVLVSPRVLERVIEQVHDLPTLIWEVPHRRSCVVDRQVLFRHIEQEDLDLNPGQLLPETVILLARPSVETLSRLSRDVLLIEYWKHLFHACVHDHLERRWRDGSLSLDDVRARIEAIGAGEFAEVQKVLREENFLVPNASDSSIYIEFVAVFLELRYFAPNLLPVYFPAIRDPHQVEQLLGQDLDAAVLFARTRLKGAPDPKPAADTSSDESHEYFKRLIRAAERAAQTGNTVRAAILRTKAARVSPGNLTEQTRRDAQTDLLHLMRRLEAALELSPTESTKWASHLGELLDRADQGLRPVEADILFDLQKACVDHEKDIYTVSLVEWALSGGKRPIQRPLPSQKLVRIGNHIQSARQRLTRARLSDGARNHLFRLMDSALHRSEERLRTRLRPVLEAALHDVGLLPDNPPERTAFEKIIEEILDRIIAHGFLTFGDLRDTLSRNELKLPDLVDPKSFVRGDPLLRLDRRLAALLDGVYRPAELYMRALEQFTSLNFGTQFGRLVTSYVTIPFGGAFLLLELIKVLLHLFVPHHGEGSPTATGAMTGAIGAAAIHSVFERASALTIFPGAVGWLMFFGLGFFLLGLMHWPALRERCGAWTDRAAHYLHIVFIDWPRRLLRVEALTAVFRSWPFQLFYWYLLTPTLICLLIWRIHAEFFGSWLAGALTFLLVAMLFNMTPGRAVADALLQMAGKFAELLRAGLIPGLFHLIVNVFKQLVDALEYVLFSVDEWLRFRSGEGQFMRVLRMILSVIWFPISYVVRFYVVVLIEPGFNPIKAPVSYLAAKVLLPFMAPLTAQMAGLLEPVVGRVSAYLIAGPTVWLLPDAFGFLFWEFKENWSLYRANRPATLRPVVIGSHGETMRRLLEPGFHSGTIPRLYAKLRAAERDAARTGTWQSARYYRRQLDEVKDQVELFVSRNFINLVRQSRSWAGHSIHVGAVDLACSSVRIELVHDAHPIAPVWLGFEERNGWIVAGISERGWLTELPPAMVRPLNTALAGLYKFAGVDVIREQAREALPADVREYDLTRRYLVAWQDRGHAEPVYYDLTDRASVLLPQTSTGDPVSGWPPLDAHRLLFSRAPLTWEQWFDCWKHDQEGLEQPAFLRAGVELSVAKGVAATHDSSPIGNGVLAQGNVLSRP